MLSAGQAPNSAMIVCGCPSLAGAPRLQQRLERSLQRDGAADWVARNSRCYFGRDIQVLVGGLAASGP